MKLQDYDIATRYQAELLSSVALTAPEAEAEVRELTIEMDSPDFSAAVGQNIGILAPGRQELGQAEQLRLYSIADVPQRTEQGRLRLSLCVRRCSYIDEYSGERYRGVTSNYLCDLQPGESLTVTGPYGQAFELPKQQDATLIMIGAGTGIAPFRAFIKHMHREHPEFKGRILLFHGGQTGLDLLYRNQEKDDFALYYDRDTFEAINALSDRPGWSPQIDWGSAMRQHAEELCQALKSSQTYVYVAGLQPIIDELDCVLAEIMGSSQEWLERKAELQADERWIELVY